MDRPEYLYLAYLLKLGKCPKPPAAAAAAETACCIAAKLPGGGPDIGGGTGGGLIFRGGVFGLVLLSRFEMGGEIGGWDGGPSDCDLSFRSINDSVGFLN